MKQRFGFALGIAALLWIYGSVGGTILSLQPVQGAARTNDDYYDLIVSKPDCTSIFRGVVGLPARYQKVEVSNIPEPAVEVEDWLPIVGNGSVILFLGNDTSDETLAPWYIYLDHKNGAFVLEFEGITSPPASLNSEYLFFGVACRGIRQSIYLEFDQKKVHWTVYVPAGE